MLFMTFYSQFMEPALNKGPIPLSIAELSLPSTSFDELLPLGPAFLFGLFSKIMGYRLKPISLPDGLTGKSKIPAYALREFHNLPNGYYSNYFTQGYARGFNVLMLGEMRRVRENIAREFSGYTSVLDLGCGDGSLTSALCEQGIKDVWGADPSPYMLALAIERVKSAKFVQAAGEATDFFAGSFEGVTACWVLHEVPSHYCDLILKECFRILKPGGKLVITEPSKHQFRMPLIALFRQFGLKGLYYRFLATYPHEPYIEEWHGRDVKLLVESHGFQLISDMNGMPEQTIVAVKPRI